MVSYLRSGSRRPGVDIAVRIEDASRNWPEGPIAVREWMRANEEPESNGDHGAAA